MIVVDIFIVLFAVAMVIVFGPIVARKIALRNPKTKVLATVAAEDDQGSVNALRLEREQRRRCTTCNLMTDPAKDIIVGEGWIHSHCYLARELAAAKKGKHHA